MECVVSSLYKKCGTYTYHTSLQHDECQLHLALQQLSPFAYSHHPITYLDQTKVRTNLRVLLTTRCFNDDIKYRQNAYTAAYLPLQLLVHTYIRYSPAFEGLLSSKSLFNFTCFVKMCMHACQLNSFSSIIDDLKLRALHRTLVSILQRKSLIIGGQVELGQLQLKTKFGGKCCLPHFIGLCCPWLGSFV